MDYHDDYSHISKTMLNTFCDSPVEYDLTYNKRTMKRKEPTRRMELGTILHEVLLEGKFLADVACEYTANCYKSNGAVNPKPAAEFRKSIWPKIAVKPATMREIEACHAAVLQTALGDALQQATAFEERFDARIEGVDCKCKPDMMLDAGDYLLVYDLKFCDPSPRGFGRSARMFRYWLQDAHYSAVLREHSGKPVEFRFFACEPTFPYRVQCYWYDPPQREIASGYHLRKLRELHEAISNDTWEDDWPNSLELTPWDIGESNSEPELVGFDDE